MRRVQHPPWERGWSMRRGIPHQGREAGLCAEVSLSLRYSLVYAQRYPSPKVNPEVYPGVLHS